MNRRPSDEDIPLPPHGVPPQRMENRGLCRGCRSLTLNSELSHYGAQCRHCFEAYCFEPQAKQKIPLKPMQRNWLAQHEEQQ